MSGNDSRNGLKAGVDDVAQNPATERRRTVIPGALAASGDTVWVADLSAPAVVRIGADDHGVLYRWDGLPGSFLNSPIHVGLCPDGAGGCWVYGRRGVQHCAPAGATTMRIAEKVEFAALAGETLAVVAAWQDRATAAGVHLLDGGGSRAIPVPGRVEALVSDDDGFTLLLRDSADSLGDKHAMLARVQLPDTLIVDPGRGTPRVNRVLVASSAGPRVLEVSAGSSISWLRRVGPDLSVDQGVPVNGIQAMWGGKGRLWVAVRLLTSEVDRWWPLSGKRPVVEGPVAPAMVVTLDPVTLRMLAATYVVAVPDHVVGSADGPVWISLWGDDEVVTGNVLHQLLRWHPGDGEGAVSVDLTQHLGSSDEVTLPVTLPVDAPHDLDAWAEQQRQAIARQLRPGIPPQVEVISVTLQGSFPDTHVTALLRHRGVPHPLGVAYPLFDPDGTPIPARHPWRLTELDEQLDVATIAHLQAVSPDTNGIVWRTPPRPPEGLLPETH